MFGIVIFEILVGRNTPSLGGTFGQIFRPQHIDIVIRCIPLITEYFPQNIFHRIFSTEYFPQNIFHRIFSTEYFPQNIFHRIFSASLRARIVVYNVYQPQHQMGYMPRPCPNMARKFGIFKLSQKLVTIVLNRKLLVSCVQLSSYIKNELD